MAEGLALALETSSPHGSVAVGVGARLLAQRTLTTGPRHTAELLPRIKELLAVAGAVARDVELVCFSQGPGSFTGLRIAATVARIWQAATRCRVVAVPSLDVVARNALQLPGALPRFSVVRDARQGRLFAAAYARVGDDLETSQPATVVNGRDWLASLEAPCGVLGEGFEPWGAQLVAQGATCLPAEYGVPQAAHVLTLGWRRAESGLVCASDQIVPAYLRPPECEEVYEQRRADARARRAAQQASPTGHGSS